MLWPETPFNGWGWELILINGRGWDVTTGPVPGRLSSLVKYELLSAFQPGLCCLYTLCLDNGDKWVKWHDQWCTAVALLYSMPSLYFQILSHPLFPRFPYSLKYHHSPLPSNSNYQKCPSPTLKCSSKSHYPSLAIFFFLFKSTWLYELNMFIISIIDVRNI